MANEHSIRVSAKGEFGQLERGLKNLQKELGSVLGEIDKGARKGGIFDNSQLRALDIFKGRFKDTMRELDKEFEKQNRIIEDLYKSMEKAQKTERRNIQDTINLREKELDVIRRKLRETEKLYSRRTSEADGYEQSQSGPSSNASQAALNEIGEKSRLDRMLKGVTGLGKGALGLAGIGGVGAILSEAYQQAYSRSVGSMDLSQRIRGRMEFSGSATNIHDSLRDIGLRNNLGYTSETVMGVQDLYSSQAGTASSEQLEKMLTFSRGYGLDAFQVASLLGENRKIAGSASPSDMADAFAQSVSQSGMVERIIEVMETNNALTAELAHTFKNYESETYLGYQTVLDKIGTQNDMYGLTGSAGGDVLSGLGGIFNANSNNKWKWMGIQALQQYSPGKYGNMSMYGLESSFEDGLANLDNLPAMAQYLRKESGGNQELFDRTIQQWLIDGGFVANKRQASELADVTGNFTIFDAGKVQAVIGSNAQGDATAKYNDERVGEEGQKILQIEAEWQKNLEQVGEDFLGVVTGLKEAVGGMVGDLTDFGSELGDMLDGVLGRIQERTGLDVNGAIDFLNDNAGALIAGSLVASTVGKSVGNLLGKGTTTPPTGTAGTGTNNTGTNANRRPVNTTGGGTLRNLLTGALKLGGGALAGLGLYSMAESSMTEVGERQANGEGKWESWLKTLSEDIVHGLTGKDFDIFPTDTKHKIDATTEELITSVKNGSAHGVSELAQLSSKGSLAVDGLSERGVAALKKLEEEGLMRLSDMGTSSTATLKHFTEAGEAQLLKLQEQGLVSIGGLQADGTAKIVALSDLGTTALQALNDNGLLTLINFDEKGRVKITELTDIGVAKLLQLQEEGSLALVGMDTTTKTKLESMRKDTAEKMTNIEKEHRTLKDRFLGIFEDWSFSDFVDSIKQFFTKWLPWGDSGVGTDIFSGSVTSGIGSVSASQLNGQLGGVLSGYGSQFVDAGQKYGINPAVLAAIAMHETGNGTSNAVKNKNNVGGMMRSDGTGLMTFSTLEEGIESMASNLKRLYIDQGLTTIEQIQRKYAPIGANNDPTNLNSNWTTGVNKYLNMLGATGTAYSGGKDDFWNNWNNRITSYYGEARGGGSVHRGLDIDGNQGDALQALASGIVEKIYMDDGGKYDLDGKANTRSGGSEIIVRMGNGEKYFYSHLADIDPNILERYQAGEIVNVAQGQTIARMGGDKGKPGSGYSTTGSHLHLGYMDSNGALVDPLHLLKKVGLGTDKGDSSLGTEGMDTVRSLLTSPVSGASSHTVNTNYTVTLNVDGKGAELLNESTIEQLKRLIAQVINERDRQYLAFNPTGRG